MQDKLQKVLNIKVDAINQNIENLNYLNGELEKNNENLNYIKDMISLFKNNEILNFDKISKDEFDHILLMIDPNISDIFRSKTCSYDGIIYIIEGIRKSISLELTEEQKKAVLSLIEGMRIKSLNLQDVIANLNESKDRLPETNLDVLLDTLEKYESIISKSENNLYLTEIDEIENALDFAEVSVEEKANMFEYILKYNADIYLTKAEVEEKEEVEEEKTVDLPEFHYEPFDINATLENNDEFEDTEENGETRFEEPIEESQEKMPTLEEIKINLDQMNKDLGLEEEKTKRINIVPDVDQSFPSTENMTFDIPIEEPKNFELPKVEPVEVPIDINESHDENPTDENHELNTVELEDIIKKIDAKLKQMDDDGEFQENNSFQPKEEPLEVEKIDYSSVFSKYALPELSIVGKSVDEVDSILGILNDNKLLGDLKNNKELLSTILINSSLGRLQELCEVIKENLLVKKDEFDYVLDIIIRTMPIVLTKEEAFNSFKANLEFFKEHKLNIINLFDNYRELLIMNHEILKDNYQKAQIYGIEINNDNVKYYLYNRHLLENMDYYLEAIGYEKGFLGKEERFDGLEYIKKHPYKLNEVNRNTLMKLRYASENNTKIYGNKPGILSGEISNPKVDVLTLPEDYKNTYFNGEYSFIDQSEWSSIKEDINNLQKFDLTQDENINKLDSSYKSGDLRYKISNILISRIKTIRIYNFLKSKNLSLKNALLIALTYNTVLKTNEYDDIKAVVDTIVEGGN